jgi:23S rRNA pseudouridine1911/1915/1917 synthase
MSDPGAPEERIEIDVPGPLAGERVDRALTLLTGVTRRVAGEIVDGGSVRINGRVVTSRSRPLRAGDRLQADVTRPVVPVPRADPDVAVVVVHEDDDVIVVDKPAGLVVHHGAGHRAGTLVDGLLARYPELARLPEVGAGDAARPGIVHRLDKGTSGLLAVARSPRGYESLSRQLRQRMVNRRYRTLVRGALDADAGIVDAPIGRSTRSPTRMTVTQAGRDARTSYRVVRRFHDPVEASLVEATLETGRTHQVRVHLAAIGHPVMGDISYDRAAAPWPGWLEPGRLFLHAQHLGLVHPSGHPMAWDSPLPEDLAVALERFAPGNG